MKRLIAFILAAAMCTVLLCSCSEAQNGTAAGSDSVDMTPVLSLLSGIADDSELTAFGSKAPSDEMMQALTNEIAALSEDDHDVSLIMVDLNTLSGVSYQTDKVMCGQSTIKAVYIGSLLENRPELFEENKAEIKKVIENSDNAAYEGIREKYGTEYLEKWCAEVGVEHDMIEKAYPRTTVKELCRLWTKMYNYLGSDQAPDELKAYYTNSVNSAAKDILGTRCKVYSKAGWENGLDPDADYSEDMTYPPEYTDKDPYNDECAINDTGVVYTDKGAYLFAIFTDHPFGSFKNFTQDNPLTAITEVMYHVQQSIE